MRKPVHRRGETNVGDPGWDTWIIGISFKSAKCFLNRDPRTFQRIRVLTLCFNDLSHGTWVPTVSNFMKFLPWRWKQQINTPVISQNLIAACAVLIDYALSRYLCNVNQSTNEDNKWYVLVLQSYQTIFTASHSKLCSTKRLTKILLNDNKERGTGFSAGTDLIKEFLETIPAMTVVMGLNDKRIGTWLPAGKRLYFLFSTSSRGDQIKNNDMYKACGTYGRQARCIKSFDMDTSGKEVTWKT